METVLTSGAVSSEREHSKAALAKRGAPLGPRRGFVTPAVCGAQGPRAAWVCPAACLVSSLFLIFPFLRLSHMACLDTLYPGKLSSL